MILTHNASSLINEKTTHLQERKGPNNDNHHVDFQKKMSKLHKLASYLQKKR